MLSFRDCGRGVLVAMDLIRAAVALCLPFVASDWRQVYLLIFMLQGASGADIPNAHPENLPNERQYTRTLSLSRLAYDLENLVSPVLAGLALLFFSYHRHSAGRPLASFCSHTGSILATPGKKAARRGGT